MTSYSYTDVVSAKDGSQLPVRGATSFHSKYNPVREGEQFAAQCSNDSTFFVVLGLCGGFHITALGRRFPRATILAVENTDDDLAFLRTLPQVQPLLQNENVITTTRTAVGMDLFEHFLPAEHTALQVVSLRAWENAFPAEAAEARAEINRTLATISADFSVQSHFGGLWQRNILVNARLASQLPAPSLPRIPNKKVAAIIAAGPSLDKSWHTLADRRNDYYIIATDTGYRALLRRGIVSDAVVSVDAQTVSHAHFFDLAPQTLCIFDLCANPASVRRAAAHNPVVLVETGHPLAQYAVYNCGAPFPSLSAGSGTVTIAALSFAVSAGFTRVQFFGADFAYSHGKAYTQGSYLDDLYYTASNRINTAETQFNRLLFRTELQAQDNGSFSTDVLKSYKNSLKTYLNANNFSEKADNYYICERENRELLEQRDALWHKHRSFDYEQFAHTYTDDLESACKNGVNRKSNAFVTLLPFIAWLKKQTPQATFDDLVQLAYEKTVGYV